jgi:DNA primase small subunit
VNIMLSTGWSRFAHRFATYYRTAELWVPPRMKLREWMFIPFGNSPPIRHKGFSDIESVRGFLSERSMHSCFYSTAYWERPFEMKMADKNWFGADLIFDLDGDHLPGVTDRDFPGMLEVIQEQAWTLWNDYLNPEFGFEEKYLQVTFSGHRGFHLHYRDPKLFHLDSQARREMVSHIRGEGVDVKGGLARFHDNSSSGWSNRIRDGMESMVAKLQNIARKGDSYRLDLNELHEGLKSQSKREGRTSTKGVTSIQRLSELLDDQRRSTRLLSGHFGVLDKYESLFLDLLKTDSSVILGSAGETDEVVTIDVRRQIRWPTSLHGKSGFRVSEFPLDRLDPDGSNPYHPLMEAIVLGTQDKLKVEMIKDDCIFEFFGSRTESNIGDIIETHEAGATFLVLKGWAKIVK